MLKFIEKNSFYIPVKKDGHDIVRISNHLPSSNNLLNGDETKNCKNVYLIFVKNKINKKTKNCIVLAQLIHLIESNNPQRRIDGETKLNNLLVEIGNDAKKGINYQIVSETNDNDIEKAIKNIITTLKTTVFKPLKYIN